MKKLIVSAAALSLLAGAAYAQGTKTDAQKKNEPNMMAPADKNSQRQGTSARPDEGGTTGNASGQAGQSGGSATGGQGGAGAGGTN